MIVVLYSITGHEYPASTDDPAFIAGILTIHLFSRACSLRSGATSAVFCFGEQNIVFGLVIVSCDNYYISVKYECPLRSIQS